MPVLIVYGIPGEIDQKELDKLTETLRSIVKEKAQPVGRILVFFPTDLKQQRSGEEIACFVNGLPNRQKALLVANAIYVALADFAKSRGTQHDFVEVAVTGYKLLEDVSAWGGS